MKKLFYSSEQALQKIKQYCAYQERSHNKIRNKLYEFGLKYIDVENIIATLIEENYLNEERFAIQFAGGKFRIKNWGKSKIKYELQQHQVSNLNIKKALAQIDEDVYLETLEKLCNSHFTKQKGSFLVRCSKTKMYLQQKGYESHLIYQVLNKQKTSSIN